ncbi:MAG: hypothetical protein IJ929_05615 [Prevotella sp.]|nr:hypothetical protein [Prevotella sp.]
MKKLMLITVLLATRLLGANADVDSNFYIYICFGQSNMEGNAQPESIDKTGIDQRFQMLACVDFSSPYRKMGQWYKATPPLVRQGTGLGVADYFGRTMVECLPENVKVGVVDVAIGGTKIEGFMQEEVAGYIGSMNPSSESWLINYYKAYNNDPYKRIVDMAKIAQQSGVIKGILLHQGCSNNGQSDWPQKVKTIYNRLIEDLGLNAADVPLFVGETLYQNQGGSCYAHNTQVARMPSVVPTSYVVSSDGCPGNGVDSYHFSALGYRILGSRYAAEALYALGVQYPFFLFHNYTFVPSKNASFNATTRTITYKDAGLTTWTYPHFADWSGYKYLVVKLKEQQTIDAEVWLYGANKNVSYRDAIGDRTTVVIDLHNLKMNNKVMDPSQVYKMAFRSPKAGKIVIDDVFLSNDSEYEPTGISSLAADSSLKGVYYDLNGRRVNEKALKSGIYIRQGKKVIR